MRNLRRISQLACLALFIYLLTRASYPLTDAYRVDIFPRLSPLLAISASVASRVIITAFWPALLAFAATLVLGRVFCGWVCPMGTTLDITDKIFKRKPNAKEEPKPGHRHVKFAVLVSVLVGAILGVQLSGWFDPLSLATRTYGMVILPYGNFMAEKTFDFLLAIPGLGPALYPIEPFLRTHVLSFQQLVFSSHALFALIFTGILLLGALSRRFWCRSLCPLGALFALTGRYALLRRNVNDQCTHCLTCQRVCMTDAIVGKGEKNLRGECVYCFTCQDVCPEKAISFSFKSALPQRLSGEILSRRAFVTATLVGVAAVPALRLNYQRKSLYPWVIRPPGVEDEDLFLEKCVRCGECMKVCIKNGLHPTLLEAGAEGLWTPKLVPRVGYCEYNCTLCGQVCPSGAIPKLTLEQKHKVRMGMAHFDKNRCIPWVAYNNWNEKSQWSTKYNCAVCEEHCPTPKKTIQFSDVTIQTPDGPQTIRRPVIVEEECIGCGICEFVCPLDGPAGVSVISRNAAKRASESGQG